MNDSVTAQAGRRVRVVRLSWLVGAVAASAGVAIVVASFFLTAAVLNNDLAAQIRHATGVTTTIHGSAHFSLLPRPQVDIENISFSNPSARLQVDAERLVGDLRILPLLVGRIEVGRATLYRPNMHIEIDDTPVTPDSTIGRAAEAKTASAALNHAQLAVVDVVDGTAQLTSKTGRHPFQITDINITADWRSLDASATLTGAFTFNAVPMQLKAWFAQPIAALRGETSATTLQLDSDAVKLLASGHVTAAPRFRYNGTLSVSAASLRSLARLIDLPFARHGKFADFELQCDANINDVATFTNVSLKLDGNAYEGTLAVQAGGGMRQLSGTLAANALDVTPFLDGIPHPSTRGQWNSDPLELTDLGFTNLDLRLSANELHLYDIELKDAALSVLTRPGFIDLALADARANGGTVKGHLTLAGEGKVIDMRGMGNAVAVDLQPFLRGTVVKHPIAGALSGSFTIESKGESFDDLMHALTGHALFNVDNGQIIGLDLVKLLNSSATIPPAPRDPNQDVTNFSKARFGLQIDRGVAKISDGRLQSDALSVSFGGNADLGARNLDLWLLATPAVGTDTASVPIRLAIQGPWSDVEIGIEHGPAPAPSPPEQP